MLEQKKRSRALIVAVKDTSKTGCEALILEKFSVTYAVTAATGFHNANTILYFLT